MAAIDYGDVDVSYETFADVIKGFESMMCDTLADGHFNLEDPTYRAMNTNINITAPTSKYPNALGRKHHESNIPIHRIEHSRTAKRSSPVFKLPRGCKENIRVDSGANVFVVNNKKYLHNFTERTINVTL